MIVNMTNFSQLSYGELQILRHEAEIKVKETTCRCFACRRFQTYLLEIVAVTTKYIVKREDDFLKVTPIEMVLYVYQVPFHIDNEGRTIILAA